MGEIDKNYKTLKGSQSFRERLLLSTLSSTNIIIEEDIRSHRTDSCPGLHDYDVSLIKLFKTVCDDCYFETRQPYW
jgi:RNA 3'-terminal phosphate cyclase-like protein